jgi:DNA replication protein DnaC
MTAFLKIDECKACHRKIPWEWVPAILLSGKPLSGTGVWRSSLSEGECPACIAASEVRRRNEQREIAHRRSLIRFLGGEKPYREFTFERFKVTPGNRLAYERAFHFDPATENLYLWGPCGVGKTHLAYAVARRCIEETLAVTLVRPGQLSRKTRMKDPEQEQAAIDELVSADALLLDDLGMGPDTAYSRQILQEILDGRDFQDRAGLVITSKYSLSDLACKMNDDTIASRLAGMCSVIEIRGSDGRLANRKGKNDAGKVENDHPDLL